MEEGGGVVVIVVAVISSQLLGRHNGNGKVVWWPHRNCGPGGITMAVVWSCGASIAVVVDNC